MLNICMQNAYLCKLHTFLQLSLTDDNMPKDIYTSIRVTKEVRDELQNYVEACYSDLSINSMLKVHLDNLAEGHVRFPKFGMFECPESRKEKVRQSI